MQEKKNMRKLSGMLERETERKEHNDENKKNLENFYEIRKNFPQMQEVVMYAAKNCSLQPEVKCLKKALETTSSNCQLFQFQFLVTRQYG